MKKLLLAGAVALAAPLAPAPAARADVAPCGRCSTNGGRPTSSSLAGSAVLLGVAGVAFAVARHRPRR